MSEREVPGERENDHRLYYCWLKVLICMLANENLTKQIDLQGQTVPAQIIIITVGNSFRLSEIRREKKSDRGG